MPLIPVDIRVAATCEVADIGRVQEQSDRPFDDGSYLRAIGSPDALVLVASLDGVIVGWAKTHLQRHRVDVAPTGYYLGGVTVAPAWRRRGVAIALTDVRIRWIAQRADEAFYIVNLANRASIELHRRWGFEEVTRSSELAGVEFSGGVGVLLRADLRTTAKVELDRMVK